MKNFLQPFLAALALAVSMTAACAANVAISALPETNAPSATAVLPIVDAGATWKVQRGLFLANLTNWAKLSTNAAAAAPVWTNTAGVISQVEGTNQISILAAVSPSTGDMDGETPSLAGAGAGNLSAGVYRYALTVVTASGETTIGTPSQPVTVVNPAIDGQVSVPIVKADRLPAGLFGPVPAAASEFKLYRTEADGSVYKLVTDYSGAADFWGNTFTDNNADAALGAEAPAVNTAIEPAFEVSSDGIVTGTLSPINNLNARVLQLAALNTIVEMASSTNATGFDLTTYGSFGAVNGGRLQYFGGNGQTNGGDVIARGGAGNTGDGGQLLLQGGQGTVNGGGANIDGGDAITGNGGTAILQGGAGPVLGGNANLQGGDGATGGAIVIQAGSSASAAGPDTAFIASHGTSPGNFMFLSTNQVQIAKIAGIDGAISAGTTNQWKLGAAAAGAGLTLVTTNYIEIVVNGVPYKLALVQ